MPTKISGVGAFDPIDRFEGGVGWIAHPEEAMQRASHALVDDGVWIVDPVDAEGLDEHLADLGDLAGVVVLFGYHRRDADDVAVRHGVSVYLPEGMTSPSAAEFDAPVERFEDRLPGTGYYLRDLGISRFWQEWALFDGETLLVPESVGTTEYFRAPGERLGVSLGRRLIPPRGRLGDLTPERILVGHGEGIHADADGALRSALQNARRTAPRMYLRHVPTIVRNLYAATLR